MPEFGCWTVRQLRGVPFLIIGHGVPRVQVPMASVKMFELTRPAGAGEAEADTSRLTVADALAAGVCPGCNRRFGTDGVTCHGTPDAGWVCQRPVESAVEWAEEVSMARLPKAGDLVRFSSHPFLPDCLVQVEWLTAGSDGEPRWYLTAEGGVSGPLVGRSYWVRWDGYWEVVRPPAEQDGAPARCPASVTQRGRRWQCDSAAGHHPAEGHVSRSGEVVWFGAPAGEVAHDGR